MHSNISEIEKGALVMRLERNKKDLILLQSKLNTYSCEPQTIALFEQLQKLRHHLHSLRESNTSFLKSMHESSSIVRRHYMLAQDHLSKFNSLKRQVEQYVMFTSSRYTSKIISSSFKV